MNALIVEAVNNPVNEVIKMSSRTELNKFGDGESPTLVHVK